MAVLVLSELTPGAPVLSGTNGALCSLLDWGLLQNGWAIEYTATNSRIYRAGSGNRYRLSVRHDSAISGSAALATVRGCENASSVSALIDPFPTVAQNTDANACWITSDAVSAAARSFRLLVSPAWMILTVKSGAADAWEVQFFGDVPKAYAEDAWNTICTSRSTSGIAFNGSVISENMSGGFFAGQKIFWARGIDGGAKSVRGFLSTSNTGTLGLAAGAPAARAGYGNRIVREKIAISDCGGSSAVVSALVAAKRGWLPNIWAPIHNGAGGMTTADTHTDTAYAGGSLFRIILTSSSGFVLLEESDTWTAPSG
jgi:hypothetical protein